jgi:hypothetical protein
VARREDHVAALERDRRQRLAVGLGGAGGEGDLLGPGADQVGGGGVEIGDRGRAQRRRFLAADGRLERQVLDLGVEDGAGHQAAAGVVEVDDAVATRGVGAEGGDVEERFSERDKSATIVLHGSQ